LLRSRIITAVILLLLLLSVLFAFSGSWWVGVVMLIVLQGAREWSALSRLSGAQTAFYAAATLFAMLAIGFDALPHITVYTVSALLWLFVVPLWMKTGMKVESRTLMCLTGWAVLLPVGLAMIDLKNASPWLLLLSMSLVWVADIGAYFSGRKYGRHKLAPGISPGKTWEGVAGALLCTMLYALIVCYALVKESLIAPVALYLLLPAVFCWVALSVVGDLFESLIKRQAGVKDSGSLLPGHGGLLDRIDALTSTLPFAAMALLMRH
jgi:phosphatidate cytidylyltransferase